MVDPSSAEKAMSGFSKAFDGFSRFTRSTSTQLVEQSSQLADQLSEQAGQLAEQFSEQAGELKEAATDAVEKLTAKEPDPYEAAIVEYNSAFTSMNDKGVTLLRQRERSADLISFVELLVNSIANTPKSFTTDFESIHFLRAEFLESEEFARKDLEAARRSATSVGVGFTAGAAVASMAPTAAMWVATTFGTASTGTAISTLSGAVASNAALAWLGGGAVAAGGGGTAAGSALLALAGPIGWTVAGATLLTSIALFTKKKFELREAKEEALTALKTNIAETRNVDAKIGDLLDRTMSLRENLATSYGDALKFFGSDFTSLSESQRRELGTLVNNTKSCAVLLNTHISQEP
ncbi:MAG: hypothetical protein QM809_08760 [Gordonia sp. (in: high G+C Gram-positive bacteria)]|uniref:hypothetical protein n=1 Tax=Gordonia sp. (in: high G+C Gram-positive bacteria) TaxID=84139 RepID=UPI0039E24962